MRAYWQCAVCCALLPSAAALAADVTAGAATDISVTVYRAPHHDGQELDADDLQGFALITETRSVSLPAGVSRVRFTGVADGIEPASALIGGLPAKLLEKNRDARILNPAALVAQALGRPVSLLRTDRKTGHTTLTAGVLVADNDGMIFQSDQGVEALRCSGMPEQLSFSGIRDLQPSPTLSAQVNAAQPVNTRVTLSYLAHDFDWTASYVAHLAADNRSIDLGAWVTLANGNGVGFQQAHVQVVAGRLNHQTEQLQPFELVGPILAQCWPMGTTSDIPPAGVLLAKALGEDSERVEEVIVTAARSTLAQMMAPAPVAITVEEEQLGDLKLYRVPVRTSLASDQLKQVRLLDRSAIPVDLIYGVDLPAGRAAFGIAATRLLRSRNDEAHHLGIALPSGTVATFSLAADAQVLLDEKPLRDVAVGEQFEISAGASTEVQLSARTGGSDASGLSPVAGTRRALRLRRDPVMRVEISSARDVSTMFELRLQLPDGAQLIAADHTAQSRAGRPLFVFDLAPHSHQTLRYQTQGVDGAARR